MHDPFPLFRVMRVKVLSVIESIDASDVKMIAAFGREMSEMFEFWMVSFDEIEGTINPVVSDVVVEVSVT
jgi:hypothetical protein